MDVAGSLYSLISVLNLLLAVAVIFLERRNVGATWAWLMIFLFLPGIGFIIYLLFGQRLSGRKLYRIKEEQMQLMSELIESQRQAFREHRIELKDDVTEKYRDMIYMNLSGGYSLFTQDNHVDVFSDGNHKFTALLKAIGEAKHHIHLMYYIVRDDGLGKQLVEELAAKAAQGVEVRFLYDDIGSAGLPRRMFQKLLDAGGQVAAFFPSRIPYLNLRLNYRNHRKLAIIDGKFGFIGGFNIGAEYLGLDPRFGPWRDTHLRVEGTSVVQMQTRFLLDWNLASPVKLEPDEVYFPWLPHTGDVGMQIVSSGPNTDREQIKNGYIKIINSAKKTLFLQTPYFVPDESMLNALKMAALSGVDVKVMIPAEPDHKIVYWASFSYLGDLLEAGVKCYLYRKGFLHAKTIVADGQVASVGTANIDIRSFKLNFEINAFMYGERTGAELNRLFENDLRDCDELTLEQYRGRSRLQLVRESLTRLLSPIL